LTTHSPRDDGSPGARSRTAIGGHLDALDDIAFHADERIAGTPGLAALADGLRAHGFTQHAAWDPPALAAATYGADPPPAPRAHGPASASGVRVVGPASAGGARGQGYVAMHWHRTKSNVFLTENLIFL
jgi:hypothetical protein